MPVLFGAKLRHLRRTHNLTQVDLAGSLGLASHTHVTKLEAGQRTASLDLVVRVADFFDVTTDYLLRDSISVEGIIVKPNAAVQGSRERARWPELFSVRLRSLRLGVGLSQTDLARRLGLARQGYLSNLETGRKAPSLDLVVHIADVFGVATDYLLRQSAVIAESGVGATGEP